MDFQFSLEQIHINLRKQLLPQIQGASPEVWKSLDSVESIPKAIATLQGMITEAIPTIESPLTCMKLLVDLWRDFGSLKNQRRYSFTSEEASSAYNECQASLKASMGLGGALLLEYIIGLEGEQSGVAIANLVQSYDLVLNWPGYIESTDKNVEIEGYFEQLVWDSTHYDQHLQIAREHKCDMVVRLLEDMKKNPLHYAIRIGKVDHIEQLLESGNIDISSKDRLGKPPIHYVTGGANDALLKKVPNLITLLVKFGADPNYIAGWDGKEPLIQSALKQKCPQTAIELLRHGAAFSTAQIEMQGPNSLAEIFPLITKNLDAAKENPEAVRSLLIFAAQQNILPDQQLTKFIDSLLPIVDEACGNELMRIAAVGGRELLVQALWELGVRGKEPLHDAVLSGHRKAAKLLVKLGADLNSLNEKGETPLCAMLGTPIAHGRTLSWLVNAGARYELDRTPQDDLNELLAIFIDSKSPPLITQMLQKGAVVAPEDIDSLYETVIGSAQGHIVEFLLERGIAPTEKSHALWNAIVIGDYPWGRALLAAMVQRGRNIDEVNEKGFTNLEWAIKRRRYPLAAFLISLGADINKANYEGVTPAQYLQKSGINPSALQHYAACLTNAEGSEKHFREQLNIKTLGHIVGDNYVRRMRDDSDDKVEGGISGTMLAFITSALEYATSDLEPGKKAIVEPVLQRLHTAHQLAERISSALRLNGDSARTLEIELIEEGLIAQLKEMPVGGVIVIPSGWNSGKSGHAILLECKRTENGVVITAVNTGEGVGFHGGTHDGARAHVNTVKQYQLPLDEVEHSHLLRAIIELSAVGVTANDRERRFGPEDLYNILEPYQVEENELPEEFRLVESWRKSQLSGTCSLRCVLAYLKTQMPPELYKDLMFAIKNDAVAFTVEQNELLVKDDAALRKLLSMALPHMFDNVAKRVRKRGGVSDKEEGALSDLTQAAERLKAAVPKATSTHEALGLPESFTSKSAGIAKEIGRLGGLYNGQVAAVALPSAKIHSLPTTPIDNVQNVVELEATLASFTAYVVELQADKEDASLYLEDYLCKLGRAFFNNHPVLEQLKGDPEACERVIAQISELARLTYEEGGLHPKVDVGQTIAIRYALASSWMLGAFIDEARNYPEELRISHYGYSSSGLHHLLTRDLKTAPTFNPKWEQDFLNLFDHDWNQGNGGAPLFNYIIHGNGRNNGTNEDPHLSLKPELGDFQYAAAHAALVQDWEQADADFQAEVSRYTRLDPSFDSKEWRVHWLYVRNKLPSHFNHLRELAWMVHINSPLYAGKVSRKSRPLAIHGPILSSTPARTPDKKVVMRADYSLDGRSYGDNSELLIAPYGQDKRKQLPFKSGSLKATGNIIGKGVDHPYLTNFWHPNQNNAVALASNRDLRELQSVRFGSDYDLEGGVVAIPLLLDYFESHIDGLNQVENRLLFSYSLFQTLLLRLALPNAPHLTGELLQFFNRAIVHYEDMVATATEINASTHTVAFLLEQKQRMLSCCRQAGITQIGELSVDALMKSTREKIQELSTYPAYESSDLQQHLKLAMVESYSNEEITSFEAVQELTTAIAAVTLMRLKNGANESLPPAFQASAAASVVQHHEAIHRLMESHPDQAEQLLNNILNVYGINAPQGSWQGRAYPVYAASLDDATRVEVNLLTGKLLLNGQEITGISEKARASVLYKALFGTILLPAAQFPTHYESSDNAGEIRLNISAKGEISEVNRKIDGQWYRYVHSPDGSLHPSRPPLVGADKLQVWCSMDIPAHYLFIEPETVDPIIRLDADGRFTFLKTDPHTRYEWVDISSLPEGAALKGIDTSAVLLQEDTKPPKRMRIQCPTLRDESGDVLEFIRQTPKGSDEEKWVLASMPNLFLSDNQEIAGIGGLKGYVVLETLSGGREALFPIRTLDSERKGLTPNATYMRVKLQDNIPISQAPDKNAFLAFLTLSHASTVQDYHRALEYLKGARKFERYSDEELRVFGWILQSPRETRDTTQYADSLRLLAAWLVHDNLQRNPKRTEVREREDSHWPKLDGPVGDWLTFWEGKWSKQGRDRTENLEGYLQRLSKSYFARAHHLPQELRIENLLSQQEMWDWELHTRVATPGKQEVSSLPNTPPIQPLETLNIFFSTIKPMEGTQELPLSTRPGRALIQQFRSLYKTACEGTEEEKRGLEHLVRDLAYDKTPTTVYLRTILHARLHGKNNIFAAGINHEMDTLLAPGFLEKCKAIRVEPKPDSLNKAVEAYSKYLAESLAEIKWAPVPEIKLVEVIAPYKRSQVPAEPLNNQPLEFKSPPLDSAERMQLFENAFVVDNSNARDNVQIEPFVFETDDPWLNDSIEALNKDYALGAKRNQEVPHYRLKEGYSVERLIKEEREAIAKDRINDVEVTLHQREEQMLALANQLPTDPTRAFLEDTARSAGRKQPLSVRECVGLFLQGDLESYRRSTHLDKKEDIALLHQMIGEYVAIHNRAQRDVHILKALDALAAAQKADKELNLPEPSENLAYRLQRVAEELSVKRSIDPSIDSAALMVFEYQLGLVLKDHQVKGIRDMRKVDRNDPTRIRSVILQRIQGGGKSLVFGHVMALLKADGYHLSVHVPPTAQYDTALYDMAYRSNQIFGQKENTIVFNDDPLRFTPKYLNGIKTMLEETIVNRQYVNITVESLQAMRCKYLKTRFLIRELEKAGKPIDELETPNQILKEILAKFKSRGIFTFDEVHIALDPRKELNMPYGQPAHPEVAQSRLIASILTLACNAVDDEGNRLLDVDHSSQQRPEALEAMKTHIAGTLTLDPMWQANMGLEDESQRQQVADFLLGTTEEIPSFLEDPSKRPSAQIVTLAKQMIAGKWLEERLQTSVNEHHGLTVGAHPRVSNPFKANMKPAKGSEFSDRFVLTTNTLIAYLSSGLDEKQVVRFMKLQKMQARIEKNTKKQEFPDLSLNETDVARRFKAGCGVGLFQMEADNPEDVEKVRLGLLRDNQEARELMLNFVVEQELPEVDIFENQVCANGQNTASMSQSNICYSGSVDNVNMAPPGTEIKLEEGTNGQTIDLLIRRNNEVVAVGKGPESLFDDLIDKHPLRADFRAIIDIGAHYRGMANEDAAEIMCKRVHESVKGVLFFSTDSGKLCFMSKERPGSYIELSGTTPEAIFSDTGLRPSELFTYYDQEHITGVDIEQMDNALAVITVSDHTKVHEMCQGPRRFRGLDGKQGVVTAITHEAIEKVDATLLRTNEEEVVPAMHDIILFSHIKEISGQKPDNLALAMQKMEDAVQQHILNRFYSMSPQEERELFDKTAYLFEKNIGIDLYREYAHKRPEVAMTKYLESIKMHLTGPLEGVIPDSDVTALNKIIDDIVVPALKGIESTIQIVPADAVSRAPLVNREGSMVQFRVEEKQEVKEQVQQQENQQLNQRLVEGSRAKGSMIVEEKELDLETFISPDFGISEMPISEGISREVGLHGVSLDSRLRITSNASVVFMDRTDILGPYRKKPWSVLWICDSRDGVDVWNAVLCSIEESQKIAGFLAKKELELPEGRRMFLTRNNGKPIITRKEWDSTMMKNPEVDRLIVQALFFSGDIFTLNLKPWSDSVENWLQGVDDTTKDYLRRLLEDQILIAPPADYIDSKLQKLLT
ncbi:MAG: hypothetical protein Q8K75_00480 [Chlamydiales bacterium]|nr:hypothetical protein [Chlamydiales bacterium]